MSEDYADLQCQKIMEMLGIFATPLGDARHEGITQQFRQVTKGIVVNGAFQKVGQLLKLREMPGAILLCRDPAHMVRIACSDPLTRTGRSEEQHKRLFTAKHALIKDIQYSEKIQARLLACQKLVVQAQGSQGGNVLRFLRHFSFAAHRWESFAGPRRQYACLLNAIFLCLSGIASDPRETAEWRRLAETCMDDMTPRDILQCGLAGDYSEICMRL